MLYAWKLTPSKLEIQQTHSHDHYTMTRHVPIDILLRTDSLRDRAFALRSYMRSQGQLHENTADRRVVVELLDNFDDLVDGGLFGEVDVLELDPDFLGGFGFHAHIHAGIGTCTGLDDDQLGLEAGMIGLQRLDPTSDIVSNRSARYTDQSSVIGRHRHAERRCTWQALSRR